MGKTYQPQTFRNGKWFGITEPNATRAEAREQIVIALNQDLSQRPNPKRVMWMEDGATIKLELIWSHGIPFPKVGMRKEIV